MSYTDITVAEALAMQGEGLVLIDVRTDAEWSQGRAAGAVHKELGTFGLDDLPEGPLLFICAVGGRSARIAEAVAQHGREAYNVDGGTDAWIAAGLPVER